MAACAAGELSANWMVGAELPSHARYFHPNRHNDEALVAEINQLDSDG